MSRQIAPRLRSGDSRERTWSQFPDGVKEGLRAIAKKERKSMSWVLEQVIIDYFHLRAPLYVKAKSTLRLVRRRAS